MNREVNIHCDKGGWMFGPCSSCEFDGPFGCAKRTGVGWGIRLKLKINTHDILVVSESGG